MQRTLQEINIEIEATKKEFQMKITSADAFFTEGEVLTFYRLAEPVA